MASFFSEISQFYLVPWKYIILCKAFSWLKQYAYPLYFFALKNQTFRDESKRTTAQQIFEWYYYFSRFGGGEGVRYLWTLVYIYASFSHVIPVQSSAIWSVKKSVHYPTFDRTGSWKCYWKTEHCKQSRDQRHFSTGVWDIHGRCLYYKQRTLT